jgi:hypothetical protein
MSANITWGRKDKNEYGYRKIYRVVSKNLKTLLPDGSYLFFSSRSHLLREKKHDYFGVRRRKIKLEIVIKKYVLRVLMRNSKCYGMLKAQMRLVIICSSKTSGYFL